MNIWLDLYYSKVNVEWIELYVTYNSSWTDYKKEIYYMIVFDYQNTKLTILKDCWLQYMSWYIEIIIISIYKYECWEMLVTWY